MNTKSLALVALRVLAIFFIVEGISAAPFLWGSGFEEITNASALITDAGISTVLSPLVLGIILWFVSPLLANRIMGNEKVASESEPLNRSSVQIIAFVTLGVYLLAVTLPGLLGLVYRWTEIANQPEIHSRIHEFLVEDVCRILLGFTLILGADFFKNLFRRAREF